MVCGDVESFHVCPLVFRVYIYAGFRRNKRAVLSMFVQTIGIPAHTPSDDFLPEQSVKVSVNVTDSATGMKKVTLLYTINSWLTWENLIIDNSYTGFYEATIPSAASRNTSEVQDNHI